MTNNNDDALREAFEEWVSSIGVFDIQNHNTQECERAYKAGHAQAQGEIDDLCEDISSALGTITEEREALRSPELAYKVGSAIRLALHEGFDQPGSQELGEIALKIITEKM